MAQVIPKALRGPGRIVSPSRVVPQNGKFSAVDVTALMDDVDLLDATLFIDFGIESSPDGITWTERAKNGWQGGFVSKVTGLPVPPGVLDFRSHDGVNSDLPGQNVRVFAVIPSQGASRQVNMGVDITFHS